VGQGHSCARGTIVVESPVAHRRVFGVAFSLNGSVLATPALIEPRGSGHSSEWRWTRQLRMWYEITPRAVMRRAVSGVGE
jgi:hypothetical protein